MGLDSVYAVVMHENESGKMVADYDADNYTFEIRNSAYSSTRCRAARQPPKRSKAPTSYL